MRPATLALVAAGALASALVAVGTVRGVVAGGGTAGQVTSQPAPAANGAAPGPQAHGADTLQPVSPPLSQKVSGRLANPVPPPPIPPSRFILFGVLIVVSILLFAGFGSTRRVLRG